MDQDLLIKFAEVDDRQRQLKQELKDVTAEREQLQADLLEEMGHVDMTSFVVNGRNYYVHNRIGVSLKPEVDSQAAEYYLRSHGLEYLMPKKIDSQKLASIVTEAYKEASEEGQDFEDVIAEKFPNIKEVFNIHQIVSLRSRKKG